MTLIKVEEQKPDDGFVPSLDLHGDIFMVILDDRPSRTVGKRERYWVADVLLRTDEAHGTERMKSRATAQDRDPLVAIQKAIEKVRNAQ